MFFVFIIPLLVLGASYYFYRHRVNWLEALVQLAIPVLFIFIFKGCAEKSRTNDTEYWSNPIVKAEYFEPWDEWIEQTCSSTCCCDKDGNNCTTTYYDCSYRRYHSARWQMVDSKGASYTIPQKEYNRLVSRFGNKSFVDLGRDYDLNDGDKYVARWDNSDEDLEICVSKHTYENRPQAATSVFNYPEVPEEDIKQYKLYEYPGIHGYQKQDHLLGLTNKKVERQLDIINARLGPSKELKLFVLVFRNQPIMAGQMQEWYWKGGNKNEFIVTIGLDDKDNVQWCLPFSWTEAQQTKVHTRNFIQEQEKIDWTKTTDFLHKEMKSNFKRKHFKEFSYLEVELTSSQVTWLYVITIILSLILGIVFILNDFDSDDTFNNRGSRNRWDRRSDYMTRLRDWRKF